MKRKFVILFFVAACSSAFAQKAFWQKIHRNLSLNLGYRFNNDFTIYYKDLKPFYYSAAFLDLQFKFNKSEIIAGIRYMPFLSAIKPEFGYNYYLHHDPESKFNYFLHTTVFYNTYSYNNQVGYENYNYHWKGIYPADYATARFQSFIQDFGLGIKMGFTHALSADFIFSGGYFYGKRDFVEGALLKDRLKEEYWGIQYGARFSLKFLLGHKAPKDDD